MAKIFRDGVTVDDTTGQVYSVGNPDNLPKTTDSPIPSVNYNTNGTRTLTAADKYWADNPIPSNADFKASQETTKADFANRQQAVIDSINNIYTSILAKADQEGKDKLGSQNVINALSGQRGSASGAANVNKVNQANEEINNGILAEKQNKINAVMSQTYKDQTEELRYENELRRKDLDAYLAYMGKKETDNLTKSKEMRAALIKNNIGVEDIAPDTLKQMADNAGYTVEQFKVLYESERKTQQDEFLKTEQKRLADLEKTKAETAKLNAEADPFDKTMMSKGYIPLKSEADLNGLTENDIIRVGDKIYRKPPNKLDEYEAKKQIDAKYKTGKNTTKPTVTYDDKTIPVDLKKEILQNIQANASKADILINYPEVSSKYIDTLYPKNGREL